MIKISKAELLDIEEMQFLVKEYVQDGIIIRRSDDELATNISSYILARNIKNNKIVAYCALHIHSIKLTEIRSLIVLENYRKKNIGYRIVSYAIEEAKKLKTIKNILVLTYLPMFFTKLNFTKIEKNEIPNQKIWLDCLRCKAYNDCNEEALFYKI